MTARGIVFAVLFSVVAWAVIVGIVVVANAREVVGPLRYHTGGRVLVIRGDRCFSAEDVTRLRLVEYVSPDWVVYRCVSP